MMEDGRVTSRRKNGGHVRVKRGTIHTHTHTLACNGRHGSVLTLEPARLHTGSTAKGVEHAFKPDRVRLGPPAGAEGEPLFLRGGEHGCLGDGEGAGGDGLGEGGEEGE